MGHTFCYVLLLLWVSSVVLAVDEVPETATDNDEESSKPATNSVLAAWLNTEKKLQENIEGLVRKMLPMLIRGSTEVNISTACQASILKLVFALRQGKPWAFKMGDAWGKPPGGMFTGTISALGSYDECVGIKAVEKGQVKFHGKYCLYDFRPLVPPKPRFWTHKSIVPELKNLSESGTIQGENAKQAHYFYYLSMRFGVCFPSTCTNHDILSIVSQFPKHFAVTGESNIPHCEVKQEFKLSSGQAVYLAFLALLLLVVFTGTALDVTLARKAKTDMAPVPTKKVVKVLMCFSISKNFQKLMNTKQSPDTLTCVHGLRFISITWAMVAHSYLYVNINLVRSSSTISYYFAGYLFQAVLNSTPSVDTFFFLSGSLVMYSLLKHLEKGGRLNVQMYIFHRLWRLAPPYFFAMASMFILPVLGSGPLWNATLEPLIDNCRKNWWTNIIFLNNFINAEKLCMETSWYMATDMQLHILSLAVIIPLMKWPKVAFFTGCFITASSTITAGLINYFHNLPPTPNAGVPDPSDREYMCATQYFKPYIHIGCYMIGLLMGYIIVKKPNMQIKKKVQTILWVLAFVIAITIVYSAQPWNAGYAYGRVEAAIYAALSKTVWSLCVAWVFFTCVNGYGGFVNTLLSWKGWIPFSRLTYCLYLVHPIVDWIHMAYQHERLHPAHYILVYKVFGDFMISLGIAFVLSLLLEAPIMNLQKIIFSVEGKESSEENRGDRSETKVPEFGSEMKPRFIPRDPNYNATVASITHNGGIDNRAFSSHL